MRLALLANILGNMHALNAVMKDLNDASIDEFIILGNTIGYGPHDNQVLKLIHQQRVRYHLKGNQESALFSNEVLNKLNIHLAHTIIKARESLDPEQLTFLEHCPESCVHLKRYHLLPEVKIIPGRILNQSDSIRILLQKFPQYATISSFYNQSFIATLDAKGEIEISFKTPFNIPEDLPTFLSVGSVGYPGGGSVTAKFGILDTDEGKITFRESIYDYTMTQRDMQVAGMSKALIRQLSPLFNKNFEEET
jgi:hypothetical protein